MEEENPKPFPTVINRQHLSRNQALFFGAVFILAGLAIVLLGLKVIPADPSSFYAPGWVIVCAGLAFVFGGAAVINGYVFSEGIGSDGNFKPETKPGVKLVQNLLGLGIVTCMLLISGWIAFGPGARQCTSNGTFYNGMTNDKTCRVVFGFGFFFILAIFVYGIIIKLRRSADSNKNWS